MNFRTTLGIGVSAVLILIAWQAMAAIVAALTVAATVAFWWVIIVGTGGVIYVGTMYWLREQDARNRYIDGQAPLREIRLKGGRRVLVDINSTVGGIIDIDPVQGVIERTPAAGWDLQQQHNAVVQTTRSLAAIVPGDAAQVRTRGAISQPRLPANITKLLGKDERPTPPPPVIVPPPPAPALAAPRMTIEDALTRSTGERWITGQADDGELIVFEPNRHAHAAIVGVTGTGKTTSVGFTLVLEALRAGWHVVILDPDGGANWQPFSAVAEWHETDRSTFPGQIAAVYRLYERRATISNPRPVLVVIEEYGDLIRQLRKSNRADADTVDGMIDAILQRGRKRRVHLALIDQYPEHWSQAVIGGTKFRAVFQLGPNQGAKMEEYTAAKLPDVGRFLTRGAEYNSFNAESAVPRLLRQLPAPSTKRVITDRPAGESSVESSPVSSAAGSAVRSGVTPPPTPATEPAEPTEPPGPTDYQARAALLIQHNPNTRQIDLVRCLGISKAYANELWHSLHPKGDNYQPPAPPTQPRETRIPDALHGWREIVEADDPASIEQMEAIRHAIASGKISVG